MPSSVPKVTKRGKTRGKKKPSTREKLTSQTKQRKRAWAMYFNASQNEFEALRLVRVMRNNADIDKHIPVHVADKYKELVLKYDETKRECPVCLDPLTFTETELTECGHMFHARCLAECLKSDPRCPQCRDRYKPKCMAEDATTASCPT